MSENENFTPAFDALDEVVYEEVLELIGDGYAVSYALDCAMRNPDLVIAALREAGWDG